MFHNILEQFQDAYVLHNYFFDSEKHKEIAMFNLASPASLHFRETKDEWFLVKEAQKFYGFSNEYKNGFEKDKYGFFIDRNYFIKIRNYYNLSLPTREKMENCPRLVQGGKKGKKDGLLDLYIEKAVQQTLKFWREIDNYLMSPLKENAPLSEVKKYFPELKKHWNLDTGIAPTISSFSKMFDAPFDAPEKDTKVSVMGELKFTSAHPASSTIKDVIIPGSGSNMLVEKLPGKIDSKTIFPIP
jgi:hypothetical protein